jgi:hypothetical protein
MRNQDHVDALHLDDNIVGYGYLKTNNNVKIIIAQSKSRHYFMALRDNTRGCRFSPYRRVTLGLLTKYYDIIKPESEV